MTPPSKKVQLKTASLNMVMPSVSGAGRGMATRKGLGAKAKQLQYPRRDTPVAIESNEYLKSEAHAKVKKNGRPRQYSQ